MRLPRPSCHALRVIFLGASHHALASPRAFCYAFRTRSYRVLSHNRDLLHLIRGPMLGLLSVPHPERRSIRAKASAAGGVSLRRCAAPSLRSQTDGFGSLACLYRDKRLPRPCQNFAVFALGNTCKVLRGYPPAVKEQVACASTEPGDSSASLRAVESSEFGEGLRPRQSSAKRDS